MYASFTAIAGFPTKELDVANIEIGVVQDVADGDIKVGYASIYSLTSFDGNVAVFSGSVVLSQPYEDFQLKLEYFSPGVVYATVCSQDLCESSIQRLTDGVTSPEIAARFVRRGIVVRQLLAQLYGMAKGQVVLS